MVFRLLIGLVFISNIMFGQRPETAVWVTAQMPINIDKHLQWHNDAGYRTFSMSPRPMQYLYRTGIQYNFNRQWNTAAGIAFFFTKADFDKTHLEFGKEFRFWEELNHQHPLNKKLQVLLRLRIEQRFFAATSTKNKYTGYRFRLRSGINQKLNDKWSLQLTDEYFQQAVHHQFAFDQNRLTFSGIYQLNKSAQLQAGYMWLKLPNDNQHIFTFTFIKTFSLHAA
jgi:Protein of unknown function (DUF2490)